MRNYLPVFILLFTTVPSLAQVTIYESDMPQVGVSYYTTEAPISDQGDPGSLAGPDYFWDYNDLGMSSTDSITYSSVNDVPLQFQFVFNNPFSASYANRALPINGFGAGGMAVPLEDAHGFFLVDSDGFYDCGYAATFNDLPLFANRNPTDRIFVLPLLYGMPADTNDSFFNVNIPSLATVKSYQTRINTLDAWGTVVTPAGTYEALRVRSVVNGVDSITIETFGVDQVIVRPETIEYRWISPEMGIPVLQINTVDGEISEIRYRIEDEEVGLSEAKESQTLNLYPNPASTYVRADLPDGFTLENATLFDFGGKQLAADFSINGNLLELNVAGLPNGLYHMALSGTDKHLSAWLVVNH